MNEVLVFLAGLALGTYYAEKVRDVVPFLDPTPEPTDSTAEV